MSTVHEVIAARHMNVPVAGVSLVTNRAAGLAGKPLSHEEVQQVAARVGERLADLLVDFLPRAVP
jgi:purine-nucleoside phosphorylase